MTYRYDPIAGVELLGQSLPDGRVTFTQPLVFLPAVLRLVSVRAEMQRNEAEQRPEPSRQAA